MNGTTPRVPQGIVILATASSRHVEHVRAAAEGGSLVIAWEHPAIAQERFPGPDVAGALGTLGIPAIRLGDVLGHETSDVIEDRVIDFVRALGRTALPDGTTFLSRLRHGALGLWWWAEIYLYHETPLRLYLRDVEAVDALVSRWPSTPIELIDPPRDLARVIALRGVPCRVLGSSPAAVWHRGRGLRASLLDLVKLWGSTLKAAVTPHAHQPSPGAPLFLTHASMWRPDNSGEGLREGYLGPLMAMLDERGSPWRAVAVGPSIPYRRRTRAAALREMAQRRQGAGLDAEPVRTYLSLRRALEITRGHMACLGAWAHLRRRNDLTEALEYHGIPVAEHVRRGLREALLLQLPWAVRAFHEMEAVLERERPGVLVLYAESSGRGRAAVAAARAAQIPSLAVQHGIVYPRYFSYEHAPMDVGGRHDGRDTCPLPTRTAVFGDLARALLVSRGHYPPESIVVTGSPRFDALVDRSRRVNAGQIRARYDIADGELVLVLATRMSALGTTFADLVAAVEHEPGLHLLVKPHPAESAAPYAHAVRLAEATRTRVLPSTTDLVELLVACDALVTVDSLASSEALVLDHPVLVLNLPNHLQPLVDSGAALGAWCSDEIGRQLHLMRHDPATRDRLRASRERYIDRFAAGADGRSAERIIAQIDDLASGRRLGQRPAGTSLELDSR